MPYHEHSTDEALREGCIQQHRLAQEYLYRRYFGRLLGIAMRYTGNRDEAVDVLNQAFLKIFNSLRQYEDKGAFQGWMAKIVVHTAIDHLRRQISYKKTVDFSTVADQPVEAEVSSRLAAEDLFRLVQKLPPATRTVFSLYVLDGYKHREIAGILGIDEGTSKWHLSIARQELQKMIHPSYEPSR